MRLLGVSSVGELNARHVCRLLISHILGSKADNDVDKHQPPDTSPVRTGGVKGRREFQTLIDR
jgi:hypothetical protein